MNIIEKIYIYLLESVKDDVIKKWQSDGISKEKIDNTLKDFKDIILKRKVKGSLADISNWAKKDFDEFENFTKEKALIKTGKEKRKSAKVIWSSPEAIVMIPETIESCKKYGQGTNWCTYREEKMKEYMFEEGMTMYFILIKDKIDEKLMYDKTMVRLFHNENKKAFEEVKPERYNKIGVDIIRQDKLKDMESGKKQEHMLIWDSLNNLMSKKWLKKVCERYKIPYDIFTERTNKTSKGKYELPE